MLTFADKIELLQSFRELTRRDVSLGRVNFHYEDSIYEKTIVAYHIHPNGNGFVYAGQLDGYDTNDKGMVNIRDFTADALRQLIAASIASLSGKPIAEDSLSTGLNASSESGTGADELTAQESNEDVEIWMDDEGHTLTLTCEEGLWLIQAGLQLEMAAESREEAEEYLQEEGFSPKR